MSLVFNGTEISKVIYNGVELDKLVYNGTTVFESGPIIPPDYLCFTATQNSTQIRLVKGGSAPTLSLQYSENGSDWYTYTVGNTITINANGKLYFRGNNTTFASSNSNYHHFTISAPTYCSGNIMTLLDQTGKSTTLTADMTFYGLFDTCSNLLSTPSLPATTLTQGCYALMFQFCRNLETLPELPATTLATACYGNMFYGCSKIKLSTTQTGEYQTPYKIPSTVTGTDPTSSGTLYMFYNTGGTFTGTPTINTTYYTSNTIV